MTRMRTTHRRLAWTLASVLSWMLAVPAVGAAQDRGYSSLAVNSDPGDPGGALPATGLDVELALIVGLCMVAVGITLAAVARSRRRADV
jgi:hypothetical protein